MEIFSALLAICAGNSPVPGEFPAQRPVTRIFDIFFDLRLNKLLSKQSWGWWFKTLSCPLWRQCNWHICYGIRHAQLVEFNLLETIKISAPYTDNIKRSFAINCIPNRMGRVYLYAYQYWKNQRCSSDKKIITNEVFVKEPIFQHKISYPCSI